MKERRRLSARQETALEDLLFEAVLGLRDLDDCRAFFRDLCTPMELQAMKDRWSVVGQLQQGLSYREIHDRTGVSVTTIGRVARYLQGGNGGYQQALKRLGKARTS